MDNIFSYRWHRNRCCCNDRSFVSHQWFEDELRKRFLAANAHVLAYRFPAGLKDYKKWEESFKKNFADEITGVSPFVHAETMGKKDRFVHAILVRGISPIRREKVQKLDEIVRPKEALKLIEDEVRLRDSGQPLPEVPSVILGSRLLSVMQAELGDTIELISPKSDEDDPFGLTREFKIVGIYDSGLLHYDNKLAILSLPAAQSLFTIPKEIVTGLEIGLVDPDMSIPIATKMEEKYNISIKEWQSYNQNIF